MKNYLLYISLLFLSCNEASNSHIESSRTDSSTAMPDSMPVVKDSPLTDEAKIAGIRNAVQHINNHTLQVQTFNWSEPSCADVGTISYYLNNDTIVKVIETGFIGDGGWTKEYYYDKGKYIFGYVQNIGGPAGLPADTNELRIYMDADTLVLQRKDNQNQQDVSRKLHPGSREYRILGALQTKKFGAALCN